MHLRLLCTTHDPLDIGSRMSRPGSSSSQPASTTTEKKPLDVVVTDPKPSPSPPKGFVQAVRDFIPPWVTNNIRQRRSQQTLFRSWLASWGALILLLPTHSLQTIGNLCVKANSSAIAPLSFVRSCVLTGEIHLVVISGYCFLSSFLQGIRFKFTLL